MIVPEIALTAINSEFTFVVAMLFFYAASLAAFLAFFTVVVQTAVAIP